jgi:type I restriction enzyme M protein
VPTGKGKESTTRNGATVGYEADLWRMADALRGSMDAAEYKHVALGLLFLKYISDAFEEHHARLEAERAQGADPEDPDEYRAQNIFWVPPEARWAHLKAQARQPTIGQLVDDAMAGIERDNPALKGVLPKEYARPALDKQRLGQLIDLVSNIKVGDAEARSKDVLGRVYEYFLSQFASAEGKKGGEFYTPRSSSSCWSRCSSRTRAASTTRAAARRECSSNRSNSYALTRTATATAAG